MDLTNDKLEKILNLNCDQKEGMEKLQKFTCNLPPLKKFKNEKELPLEEVEKAVTYMLSKYGLGLQQISVTVTDEGKMFYIASVMDEWNYKWLKNVYARSLKELWCKFAIKLYYEIKNNDEIESREKIIERRKLRRGLKNEN